MVVEKDPLKYRRRRFLWRVSGLVGVRQYELREIYQLADHILERVDVIYQSPADRQRMKDWLASRFTFPMRNLLIQAKGNGKYFFVLNTIVVGGGFTTSGIAVAAGAHKGSAVAWVIFGFGLLVALAGGITQVYRPGHRASERLTLVMKMREEGWAFANATDSYAGDDDKAFALFDARLSDIHRQATHILLLDSDAVTVAGSRRRTKQ